MSTEVIESDVLIIGTGPIGAMYARCLATNGKRVHMLEAGPQVTKRPGEHLLNCHRFQHEPNLSLDAMYANHEVFSVDPHATPWTVWDLIPGFDTLTPPEQAAARSELARAYNPDLPRLNFDNPRQDPKRNMPFASSMWAVGGMFSFWSGYAPIPTLEERTDLISAEDWKTILAIALHVFDVHWNAFDPSCRRPYLAQDTRYSGAPNVQDPHGCQGARHAGKLTA